MSPEDVKPEWVEKAARAVYEASAQAAYSDPYQSLDEGDWPEWDVEDPFFSELLVEQRIALAAVLPEAMAEAWDEGKEALAAAWHPDAAPLINPYREGSPS
jgi:hypothetical protein